MFGRSLNTFIETIFSGLQKLFCGCFLEHIFTLLICWEMFEGKFDQRIIPHHVPVTYYIQLHLKFDSWKDFIETLAHEMVHLYQMTVIKDPYSNHNANFYKFVPKFKKIGLKLHR